MEIEAEFKTMFMLFVLNETLFLNVSMFLTMMARNIKLWQSQDLKLHMTINKNITMQKKNEIDKYQLFCDMLSMMTKSISI